MAKAITGSGKRGGFTAHDVRRLRMCAACKGLGMKEDFIADGGKHFHGHCYIVQRGIESALKLPLSELYKFAVGDMSAQSFKRIMNQSAKLAKASA